jgi:carbonic anhydrase/acetyltransferase-like protein (isoleucine patch superfamily)
MAEANFHRMRWMGWYWQAENTSVCGDVLIGEKCSIWFGATIRGDVARITIGQRTNIQDGAIIHCDSGVPQIIGEQVTAGHGAVLHGARIGNRVLIGMKAVLLGRTVVEDDAIIAAGAVLSPGMHVPAGMVAMGVPAKIVRPVRPQERIDNLANNDHYVKLADAHCREPEKYAGQPRRLGTAPDSAPPQPIKYS